MQGRRDNSSRRALLHRLTGVQNQNAVRHLARHTQVMRDEQQRHVAFRTQPLQQDQDLRLDRHIQRGGRLISNQQRGIARQRNRNHDPLAQAA